jgi:hypothetical protein
MFAAAVDVEKKVFVESLVTPADTSPSVAVLGRHGAAGV